MTCCLIFLAYVAVAVGTLVYCWIDQAPDPHDPVDLPGLDAEIEHELHQSEAKS